MARSPIEPVVFVVDDDEAVRCFLKELIESVGLRVEALDSAQAFLKSVDPAIPGCLVMDIRMPGKSGLELLRELSDEGIELPAIVLTGHGSVAVAVHAMKSGAVDFIEKPFNNELLLDSIQRAVSRSMSDYVSRVTRETIAERLALLTRRERQILDLVISGETNKGIANTLGIGEKTVELHRGHMMHKMEASSLASLIRMALTLDVFGGNP